MQSAQTRMSGEEVAARGKKLYAEGIRAEVEMPENIGKMVIIDVETGDYEVDKLGLSASRQLHAKHRGAELYGIRIGYKSAEVLGGALEPVSHEFSITATATALPSYLQWSEVSGTASSPMTGEDAQDWVTRSRQQ